MLGLLELAVVIYVLRVRAVDPYPRITEVVTDRLHALEGGEVVKLQLQPLNVQLLRLRVRIYQRVIDLYLLGLVVSDLNGVLVDHLDLNGEEQERRLYQRLCTALIYGAENKGVSDIKLIPSRLLLDLLDLSLKLVYLGYLVLDYLRRICVSLTVEPLHRPLGL